ncbi:MAG: NUDIX domain-containing protein [Firmicutes bacterium]|nr:NUDIX domain-containing protein [Bacillota bacterium]
MGKRIFQVLVIPYKRGQDGVKYAIFRLADLQVWQWITGGGEVGETPICAAKREAWEEARIPRQSTYLELDSLSKIPASCFIDLAYPEESFLTEHSFGVEVDHLVPQISREHTEYRWISSAEAQLLKYESNKVALKELNAKLG